MKEMNGSGIWRSPELAQDQRQPLRGAFYRAKRAHVALAEKDHCSPQAAPATGR